MFELKNFDLAEEIRLKLEQTNLHVTWCVGDHRDQGKPNNF